MSKHHGDKTTRDLLKRVTKLEREALRLRQGVMGGATSVAIGGATEVKSPVRVIGGATTDDRVSVLTAGKDAIALSPGNDYSGAVDMLLPDGLVTKDMAASSLIGEVDLALSEYKTLTEITNYLAATSAAGAWLHVRSNLAMLQSAVNLSALGVVDFDPDEHDGGTRDLKLRLIQRIFVNNVSPGASRTLQPFMARVTNSNSANVAMTLTGGGGVTGSTPSAQTIAASSSYRLDSGDFDAPELNSYALGVTLAGGAMAASSYATIHSRLLCRLV